MAPKFGVPELDENLSALAIAVGELRQALEAKVGSTALLEILTALVNRVLEQIDREERLMISSRNAGAEAHRLAHDHIIRMLSGLVTGLETDPQTITADTTAIISTWLEQHFRHHDHLLAEAIQSAW